MASERNKVAALQANHAQLSRDLAAARTQELNHRRELVGFSDEVDALKKKHAKEVMDLEMDVKKRDRELREVKEDLALARGDLEREREVVGGLKNTLNQQSTAHMALEAQVQAMQAQNSLLQNQNDDFAHTVAEYQLQLESNEKKIAELKNEILESEIVRRKLHNMVQELKGNIRVFCRVRPVLSSDFINNPALSSSSPLSSTPSPTGSPEDIASAAAQISFPDASETKKQITLTSFSESATGQERRETHSFTFDRVFAPDATQSEVFEEISLLAQSCMDGYNVCIFAYGQTGSGKSFTMEGAQGPLAGMIPRAVEQVFRVAAEMKSKGWEYTIEGQFLEIYNETINDLLARGALNDKKKHEIKHDPKTGATRVTDITVVPLRSASQVQSLLALAHSRRSVAATLMNERSSRSHSIFTLRIAGVHVGLSSSSPSGSVGENGKHGLVGGTGERCNGCLNLVDLAGSERLNVSFASGPGAGLPDKERVKETQNINKSLSALGDVIAALGESGKADKGGEKGGHVPYRNSKLTYLLQNSLSGNSKTLMFLNLSPLRVHMNESLTSLRFATKVNNTHVGTAKKRSS
ncbi:kinesin-domain-containing protein [Macrolepiota fuliginosa MF-IS2]|uniref:Kinesin-domain-containing protein n=1 Tax=Macrolepiota fuliginosa MF-IS2 TaxID=1400762 RepID=A0A9P5WZ88_9AGAR|nr:kinesin-domain-containing protein [Macrolepiota fuliginosa MF-IS2]